MVRRYDPGEKRKIRPLYWILVVAIVFVWVWGFKLYFQRYEHLRPEVTWAVAGFEEELTVVEGALLWKETVLTAPFDGTVTYPLGRGPVRVGRGSIVAVVRQPGKITEIKAYQQGYFIAGTDGSEDSWRYSELWPGIDLIPRAEKLRLIENGAQTAAGQAIGKLIEQPQELRFIGYADIRGNMDGQIKNKRLKVKMDEDDTVSTAEIRVSNELSKDKVKLYLTLSWFQPSLLTSRNYRLVIEAGNIEGAVVPESALLQKGGSLGVYIIRRARVVFCTVKGKHIDGGRFLVTEGLSVGDAVVENSSAAREGRIQLW